MDRIILVLVTTFILLIIIAIPSLSQRKNEIPSVTSVLIRTTDSYGKFSLREYDTTFSSDSGRFIGYDRSMVVLKKAGLGFLLGALFVLPSGFIGGSVFAKEGTWNGFAAAIISGCIGYVVGSSYGVHLVSISENPKSNYWSTLGSGCLGVGFAYAISVIAKNDIVGTSAAIVFPIAFPIIYTELIE
jgi:hypothetical protein